MQNFIYSIPTSVNFGAGMLSHLGELAAEFGTKALLVTGGGSVRRSGIYQKALEYLKAANISWVELSGVEPNPRITSVRAGVAQCKEHGVQMVIPIGGGSVIDCAKLIVAGACYDGDPWELVLCSSKIQKALPILPVLTLAATGSEMDYYAVISNLETNDKISFDSPRLFPKYAILDPAFSITVSPYQTASGVADIMSHVMEVYFQNVGDTYLQNQVMEGLLRTCIRYGPIALQEPDNYDARANLMWASSWAINGFIACGKSGAWVCHPIEHELSAYYDVTHGVGLAVIIPHWMRQILSKQTLSLFTAYGVNVWGISPDLPEMEIATQAIQKTEAFFQQMGLAQTLREMGIADTSKFEIMAEKAARSTRNANIPLEKEDILSILQHAF